MVSASSGGIGHAIATAFAREGAEVIINSRSEDSVNSAVAQIKEKLLDVNKLLPLAALINCFIFPNNIIRAMCYWLFYNVYNFFDKARGGDC